jgi:trk system potassium uptake protein TrkA
VEAEPVPPLARRVAVVEHPVALVWRYAGPVLSDVEPLATREQADGDRSALAGVLDRVSQQVLEALSEPVGVGLDGQVRGYRDRDGRLPLGPARYVTYLDVLAPRMEGAIVIVGAGRVGFRTAQLFGARGHEVRLVERDAEKCQRLRERSEVDVEVVTGDGTRPAVLERALAGEVGAFGALIDDGETNLQALLVARELAPDARFVARVRHEPDGYREFFGNLRLVNASSVAASANALGADVGNAVREHVGGMEVLDLTVGEDAPVAGRTLASAGLPAGCLVVTIGGEHRADGETTLDPGATVTVAVERDAVRDTRRAFGADGE